MLPYQPYNPMFNPNIPNQNYPTQPQQSPLQSYQQRPPIIPGRVVADINEVTPNEIPMDGRVSLFPKNDYSCIYAKAWNSDGTITTVKFVAEQPSSSAEPAQNNIEVALASIKEQVDKIDKRLDRMQKPMKQSQPRKEESSND